jgi:parallel beta-helix repeat protein
MSAGLIDMRKEGPPGDTGTFQGPCSALLFKFTFSGTVYNVGVMVGDRGWSRIWYGTATEVVNALSVAVNAAGGGEIHARPGLYIFTSTVAVTILANVHFVGEGWNNTIFQLAGAVSVNYYLALQSNTVLRGIKLDCQNLTGGVDVSLAQNVTISECWIINCNPGAAYHCIRTAGTQANPVANVWIVNNRLSGGGDDVIGTEAEFSTFIYIVNNDIGAAVDSGIESDDGAHDIWMVGNTVKSPTASIDVHSHGTNNNPKCYNIFIIDNYAEGLDVYGKDYAWLGNHANIVVSGNICKGSGRFDSVNGCTVVNNQFLRSGTWGVYIGSSNNIVFSGNVIKYSAGEGIKVELSNQVQVTNNKIVAVSIGHYDYAIDFADTVTNFHIKDNTIYDDITTMSLLTADAAAGQKTVVVANARYFEEGQPIYLHEGAVLEAHVIDKITGCFTITLVSNIANPGGFTVAGGAHVDARSTTPYGIHTVSTCSVGQVVGNLIISPYGYALVIDGTNIWCHDNKYPAEATIGAGVFLKGFPLSYLGLVGTATLVTATPTGVLVDAAGEGAVFTGWVPNNVKEVQRIRISAVALAAPGEGNAMCVAVAGNSGKPVGHEPYNSENISVANKLTSETNFAVNDAIEWIVTDTDDAHVDDIGNGETIEIIVSYNAASGANIATNALIRSVWIEYT